MAEKSKKKLSFEEAMEKIEADVSALEGGKLSLAESLSAFEEGIKLLKSCTEMLENAERKVEMLTEDGTAVPFGGESSDET